MDDDAHTTLEARRHFANALRVARLQYGRETGQGELSQKEFARMLGINGDRPEERYRLYEGAKREPPLWILAALRQVTGYSLDNLIAQLPAGRPLGLERPAAAPRRRTTRPQGTAPPDPMRGARAVKSAGADLGSGEWGPNVRLFRVPV